MKFFRDLFLRTAPKGFRTRKFRHIEPLVLPFTKKNGFKQITDRGNWLIEQVNGPNSLYFEHLIPPTKNRINTSSVVNEQRKLDGDIAEPKVKTLFHCTPMDPNASLQHFIITLHENFVISLMAIPQTGNGLKLCQALCNTDGLPNLKKLNDPALVNDYSFQFISEAGADPRARASLVVRCDNEKDSDRVEAFLEGVHRFCPFSSELMKLAYRIIEQNKELVLLTSKADALVKEKQQILLPSNILFINKYPQKIQDEVSRINTEIKMLENKSSWQGFITVPLKERLDLFAGYPNGIPDLQKQKNILTYYPESLHHFPEHIPEIHLAILSGDGDALKAILDENPMAVYARDFHGNLPIELANKTMHVGLASVLFNTWENLPRAKQWATRLFIEAANKSSELEFRYSYILDKELQSECIQHYFREQLPFIDQPLLFYQAIVAQDQEQLTALCAQEMKPWLDLRHLCVDGKIQEARQLFAQRLPQKHAVFAAVLQGSWNGISEAINDYIPNIIDLDNAVRSGKRDQVEHLRKEVIIKEWKELQDAIDQSANIAELEREKEQLIESLKCLEEPLSKDKDALEAIYEQLRTLHEKQAKQLAPYRKVWSKVNHSQMQLDKRNQSRSIQYVEWFKEHIRKATQNKTATESLEISKELMNNEVAFFNAILLAIKEDNPNKLKQLFKENSREPLSFLKMKFHFRPPSAQDAYRLIFDSGIMPPHFDLYVALFNNDKNAAIDCVDNYLNRGDELTKKEVVRALETVDSAKQFFHRDSPVRSQQHQQICHGIMPPITQYIAEKNAFEEYKQNIRKVFQEQCELLKEVLNSAELEYSKINFIRIISDDCKIEESLERIITDYVYTIVINLNGMAVLQKTFEDDFESYINSQTNKSALKEMWQKAATIKAAGIQQIKQHTEDYHTRSLCQDDTVFTLYTEVLIYQQAAILYQDVLNKKRGQSLDLYLTEASQELIKKGSSRFVALNGCYSIGATHDLFLDSIIKSSLLSYESQDPWGYTPLLLAIANNHIDIVRAFFENDLVTNWVMPLGRNDWQFYTVLSHARSREMTDLILHFFTDPNTTFAFHEGLERHLAILLYFHHEQSQCVDTHGQGLLDYIAAGHPYPLEYLEILLKDRETFVQEGPYDPSMPLAVQQAFERHNARIAKKLKQYETRPKIITISQPPIDVGISQTVFKIARPEQIGEGFYSILKKPAQLTSIDGERLPIIFSENFECPEDPASYIKPASYFKDKVLSNEHYFYELFYQEGSDEPIGFFCFQVKPIEHEEFGCFLLTYLSIAACAPDFSDRGLLGCSFNIMLALKKCSDDLEMPLKYFGRIGRPGVAASFFPRQAISSPKYHNPRKYIDFIANDCCHNPIEKDGSSIPPVRSRAKIRAGNNVQIDEFNFILDERLHASSQASLPVIAEVDETLTEHWHKKLALSHDITEQQVTALYENLKPWVGQKQEGLKETADMKPF